MAGWGSGEATCAGSGEPRNHRSHDGRDLLAQRVDRHRDQLLLQPQRYHAMHRREQASRGDARSAAERFGNSAASG